MVLRRRFFTDRNITFNVFNGRMQRARMNATEDWNLKRFDRHPKTARLDLVAFDKPLFDDGFDLILDRADRHF